MTTQAQARRPPGHVSLLSLVFRPFFFVIIALAPFLPTPAQESAAPQTPAPTTSSSPQSEISIHDSESTFKVRVNLVQVRVVVRDASGKPVGNLHRADFEVYDQGKLQAVSSFDVETASSRRTGSTPRFQGSAVQPSDGASVAIPERFLALVFDDVHLAPDEVSRAREAASRFLYHLAHGDRAAVYCTSGQSAAQEFTDDGELLNKAVNGILPHPLLGESVAAHTAPVAYGPPVTLSADSAAPAEMQDAALYARLHDIVNRLAAMPGERILLLVSPGFASNLQEASGFGSTMSYVSGIVDSANRAGVVINTLDARSLYASPRDLQASTAPTETGVTGQTITAAVGAEFEKPIVLQDFAAGTGGTFFQNSNDLAGGFARLGSSPEVVYVLGFSPHDRKLDGQYHLLNVKLTGNLKYSVQARHGYFAPRKANDPREQARAEIEDAIYSGGEIRDFSLELQTQYFDTSKSTARLSVISQIGLKSLHFRREGDRNVDTLTLATAVFDENGNLAGGAVKNVEMRLTDATYARLTHAGFAVRSSLEVPVGDYIVRQVVFGSEGSQMAARNSTISIH